MADQPSSRHHGILYVVATPIGNLNDITLRAIETLKQVDLIAAEDTRHTRRLLNAHGIDNQMVSYHDHNERQRTPELIAKLERGTCIALVSDAGTPSVSDPGYRLVAVAATRGLRIVPIPGVSAAVAALSVCGLPTNAFTFVGFPVRKKNQRLCQLEALRELPHTLIFYQSPRRLVAFLGELVASLGDRMAVLAREQTKLHEEYIRAPLSELAHRLGDRDAIKGECTLLVGGAETPTPSEMDITEALQSALAKAEQPIGEIARGLAKQFGLTRKEMYDRALKLKKSNR
jgi:16S rRNA (cytidine1402-2'-O)-methyltransferase